MTMGLGRTFKSLSELGIAFICNADGNDATHGSNDPSNNPCARRSALGAGEKYVQAILLPEFFAPMLGYIALCPDLRHRGSPGSIRLPSTRNRFSQCPPGKPFWKTVYPNIDGARIWGGNPGWRYPLWGARGRRREAIFRRIRELSTPSSARR